MVTLHHDALGAPWLEFLITLHGRYRAPRVELLSSPDALADLLSDNGLAPARRPDTADLTYALVLREAMHAVTVATYTGEPCRPKDLRILADALDDDEPVTVTTRGGPLRGRPPSTARGALARLVRDQVADLTGPRRALLKPCGDPTCSGYFLDLTGRRQWCSSSRCGSRVRVRRHRARQQS